MKKITSLLLKLPSKYLLALSLLFSGTGNALASAEITTCIIDLKAKNNNHYFYLPTPSSILKCEGFNELEKTPTMKSLYADGWQLIQILPIDFKIDRPPSAAIYLERIIKSKTDIDNEISKGNSDDKKTK